MAIETAYETSDDVMTLLARPDIAPMFYVLISGIPYAFSNLAIPEAWDAGGGVATIDSESYTWSQTLVVRDDFGGVSQKAEPKRGLGAAGSQTFEFSLTGSDDPESDLWFDLLVRNLHRTDKAATNLGADIDPDLQGSSETITVDDATDFDAAEQDIYIGTETIRAGAAGNTPTALLDVDTRGAYKSWAQAHRVTTDPSRDSTAGGTYVTQWPVVWEGRVVRLYMALGLYDADGVWRPYQDSTPTRIVQEIYKGVITGVREGGDTLSVSFETASVDQLLSNRVATRLPTADVMQFSRENKGGLIYVGPHNWYLSFEWQAHDTSAAATGALGHVVYVDQRLYDEYNGVDLAEGLYTVPAMCQYIADTIKQAGIPQAGGSPIARGYSADIASIGVGKDVRAQIGISFVSTNIDDYDLTLLYQGGQQPTILRDLGFTSDAKMLLDASSTARIMVRAVSNEAPPTFRWPARSQPAPGRIYIKKVSSDTLNLQASPGYVDDDGNSIPAAVLLDKAQELVTITGSGTTSVGSQSFTYLTVGERGVFGTGKDSDTIEKYDPDKEAKITIQQGIYLPNTSLHRALFYLFIGGSGVNGTLHATWDKGWEGSGLALPADLIDIDGITAVAENISPRRDQIWIGDDIELRRWLEPELMIEQILMIGRADFETSSEYQLTWVETHPPLEYTIGTERTLDHTRLVTDLARGGVGLDRQENKILNSVKVRCAYDHGSKKYATEINQNHVTSQQTWGARERVTLDVRNLGGAGDSVALAKSLGQRIFDRYAHPYEVVELDVAYAPSWGWQIGDVVNITHSALPTLASAGRGWDEVKARIYIKKDYFIPGAGVSSRLTCVVGNAMGARHSTWAPSALLTSDASGGARTTFNVADHEFSGADKAKDLSYFLADFRVLLWLRGTFTTDTLTIDSVDNAAGTVTFTSAASASIGAGVGDVIMMLAAYGTHTASNVPETQKNFGHMSDFDGVLYDGAVDDIPYKYV